MLAGKCGMVFGFANHKSLGWAIADVGIEYYSLCVNDLSCLSGSIDRYTSFDNLLKIK